MLVLFLPILLNLTHRYCDNEPAVKGGGKTRRAADQNRGTPALCTPHDTGCQLFPFQYVFRPWLLWVGGITFVGLGAACLEPALRFPQSIAGTVGLQDVYPMGQAVQQGAGQPLLRRVPYGTSGC